MNHVTAGLYRAPRSLLYELTPLLLSTAATVSPDLDCRAGETSKSHPLLRRRCPGCPVALQTHGVHSCPMAYSCICPGAALSMGEMLQDVVRTPWQITNQVGVMSGELVHESTPRIGGLPYRCPAPVMPIQLPTALPMPASAIISVKNSPLAPPNPSTIACPAERPPSTGGEVLAKCRVSQVTSPAFCIQSPGIQWCL